MLDIHHLILVMIFQDEYYYNIHSVEKDTETQTSHLTYSGSQHWSVAEVEIPTGLSDSKAKLITTVWYLLVHKPTGVFLIISLR